ncbi:5-oxoprolinase, partial [Zancudomyces culisetae]
MKARPTLDKSFLGQGKINVSIDRGGTFTDCYGVYPVLVKDENGVTHEGLESVVIKLLSEDPTHYPDAPQEGIRRILEIATGIPHPRNTLLDTSNL